MRAKMRIYESEKSPFAKGGFVLVKGQVSIRKNLIAAGS